MRRVWRRTVLWVVCSGCGFQSSGGPGDGSLASQPPDSAEVDAAISIDASSDAVVAIDASLDAAVAIDASPDAAIDAPIASPSCLPRWLDGTTLALSMPAELGDLSTGGSERDPWVSPGGLTLYFSRDSSPTGGEGDIFQATRATTSDLFRNPSRLDNLSTGDDDDRPSLTADENMLVLASDRDPSNTGVDIYITTRTDTTGPFGSPNRDRLARVNAVAGKHFDPFLNGDGLHLYFAPAAGAQQRISVATRTAVEQDFATPNLVGGIRTAATTGDDADPALSQNERVIVFSSTRSGGDGGTDLWFATRSGATGNFSTPSRIPNVNSGKNDGDPMLSADGCDLYFASTRDARNGNANDYNLYVAHVMP